MFTSVEKEFAIDTLLQIRLLISNQGNGFLKNQEFKYEHIRKWIFNDRFLFQIKDS